MRKVKTWKGNETIEEVLVRAPGTLPVLMKYFSGCFLCPNVMGETLRSCAVENKIPLNRVLNALRTSQS